jgi:hypothetical protein
MMGGVLYQWLTLRARVIWERNAALLGFPKLRRLRHRSSRNLALVRLRETDKSEIGGVLKQRAPW